MAYDYMVTAYSYIHSYVTGFWKTYHQTNKIITLNMTLVKKPEISVKVIH